jgi:hypothetical protein
VCSQVQRFKGLQVQRSPFRLRSIGSALSPSWKIYELEAGLEAGLEACRLESAPEGVTFFSLTFCKLAPVLITMHQYLQLAIFSRILPPAVTRHWRDRPKLKNQRIGFDVNPEPLDPEP